MEMYSLRDAIELLDKQGISVKWMDDLTMKDFFSYYDAHYFKAINKALDSELKTNNQTSTGGSCLRFLRDDLLNIFA